MCAVAYLQQSLAGHRPFHLNLVTFLAKDLEKLMQLLVNLSQVQPGKWSIGT